jgi:hypothetical protein
VIIADLNEELGKTYKAELESKDLQYEQLIIHTTRLLINMGRASISSIPM